MAGGTIRRARRSQYVHRFFMRASLGRSNRPSRPGILLRPHASASFAASLAQTLLLEDVGQVVRRRPALARACSTQHLHLHSLDSRSLWQFMRDKFGNEGTSALTITSSLKHRNGQTCVVSSPRQWRVVACHSQLSACMCVCVCFA